MIRNIDVCPGRNYPKQQAKNYLITICVKIQVMRRCCVMHVNFSYNIAFFSFLFIVIA